MGWINFSSIGLVDTSNNNGANGHVEIIDPSEPFITEHLENDLWKLRIQKMVRAAKDLAASKWAVPILLVTILGYWVYSDQRTAKTLESKDVQIEEIKKDVRDLTKMMTRLETLREVDDKSKIVEQQNKEQQKELDRVYRERVYKDFNDLRAAVNSKLGIKSDN